MSKTIKINWDDSSLFERIERDDSQLNVIVRPCLTYWQDAWIRLSKNKVALLSLTILILYIVLAIVGPYMTHYDYKSNNPDATDLLPNFQHWFGTDSLGRDMWERIWMGGRVSLAIGFAVTILNTSIGMVIGGISGYFGGKLDMFIMRVIDVLYGIPTIIVAILVMMVLNSGIASLIIAMVAIGWIGSARFIRGQILQLKNLEFVLAAKSLGASSTRIIALHLIPNIMGLIITNLAMAIPNAIFTEAFLSYIGLGIQSPATSWGQLAKQGAMAFRAYPYQLFIPAFFVSTTMLTLNLLGDGLRDALDPRQRGRNK